jgi:hypothetical protein
MNFIEWSKSSVDYGQKLVNSALEGAREGEDEFLQDESLVPYLGESAREAAVPAIIGAYVGAFGASLAGGRRSTARTVAFGLLGGAIGFGAGLLWQNRELGARVASSAWDKINKTRDEHWFEKNPIDYA